MAVRDGNTYRLRSSGFCVGASESRWPNTRETGERVDLGTSVSVPYLHLLWPPVSLKESLLSRHVSTLTSPSPPYPLPPPPHLSSGPPMALPTCFFPLVFFVYFECKPNPGFDEFDFKVGGLLLFLNTFGTEILAALALPLTAAAASASASGASQDSRRDPPSPIAGARGADAGGAASLSPTPLRGQGEYWHPAARSLSTPWNAAAGTAVLSTMERLSALTLLLSSFRTFLSAANVSVQRGHLMLWAVFAPKFVFDATMQAVCGAAAVLAWAVVVVAHGAYFSGRPAGAWLFSAGAPWGRRSLPARKKVR